MDKELAKILVENTFHNNFDKARFEEFTKELFYGLETDEKRRVVWSEFEDYIDYYETLGTYTDPKNNKLEVLVVKLKKSQSRDRARVMHRNFVAKYLKTTGRDAALIAFYGGDDPTDWRLSFVKLENKLRESEDKVEVTEELTPAKRYSFLIGVNEPNNTCRRRFFEILTSNETKFTLGELENTFNIENVTDEFFNEYKKRYLELKEALDKILENDVKIRNEFEEKDISSTDFTKKLLGQIVFLYFLQKKGWLGVERSKEWGTGPKDFMTKLFGIGDSPLVPYKNFFNDILEPLFYEALASSREGDDGYYAYFKCKIPFLNGGLFEPINEYNWTKTDILIDNDIFRGIFETFNQFNFTVKEDEPLEKEVAVDPEMLGKVFEKLLEVKDKKAAGTFYTPREIVSYMCQESILNYLETNSPIPRTDIEKFIRIGDFANIPKSIKDNYLLIDKLLKEIKVVDPAVGSGAFPVGMMNEIVKARSILSILFKEERKTYDLKREIIENCLYGVDIEPSAIEITKLRFWLSLIVDELDMKNIKPLPNLDYKIICGNSLLEEFEGIKLFNERLVEEEKREDSPEIKEIDEKLTSIYKKKGEIVTGKKKGLSIADIQKEIKKLKQRKHDLLSKSIEKPKNLTLNEALTRKIRESKKKLSELKKLQKEYFEENNRRIKNQLRENIDKIVWKRIGSIMRFSYDKSGAYCLDSTSSSKCLIANRFIQIR